MASEVEDDIVTRILSLLDESPEAPTTLTTTLEDVLKDLSASNEDTVQSLDVLSVVSPLLRSTRPAAWNILLFLGKNGNAKELSIATQEGLAHLEAAINDDSEFEDESSPVSQLSTLIRLYSLVLPRVNLRKKTPEETLSPLLAQLRSVLNLCSQEVIVQDEEGITLVDSAFTMIDLLLSWSPPSSDQLLSLADTVIIGYHKSFRNSIAQRSFRRVFPRLMLPGSSLSEETPLIGRISAVYSRLGILLPELPEEPNIPFLVLLSHTQQQHLDLPPSLVLTHLMPLFIACIQQNIALEESLAVLITSLNQLSSRPTDRPELDLDIIVTLTTLLPPLASAHPDPSIRHLIFKIISLILTLTPSQLRLEILRDLTSSESSSQMRIAAIGLVKESLLQGLTSASPNSFASPTVFQELGVLKLDPPNVLASLDPNDINDSPEPSRLAQCLSLYYTVIMRDTENKTGVRGRASIESMEKIFLAPIRHFVQRCFEAVDPQEALHGSAILVSLQMGLERVDSAIDTVAR